MTSSGFGINTGRVRRASAHAAVVACILLPAVLQGQSSKYPDGGTTLSILGLVRFKGFLDDPAAAVRDKAVELGGEAFRERSGVDGETLANVAKNKFRFFSRNMETVETCLKESDAKCAESYRRVWEWNQGDGLRDLVTDAKAAVLNWFPEPIKRSIERFDAAVEAAGFLEKAASGAEAALADAKDRASIRARPGLQHLQHKVNDYLGGGTVSALEPGSSEAVMYETRQRTSPDGSDETRALLTSYADAGAISLTPPPPTSSSKSALLAGVGKEFPALQPVLESAAAESVNHARAVASSFPLSEYPEPVGAGVLTLCDDGRILTYTITDQQSFDNRPSCKDEPNLSESLLANAVSGCKSCESLRSDSAKAEEQRKRESTGLEGLNHTPTIAVRTPSVSEALGQLGDALQGKSTSSARGGVRDSDASVAGSYGSPAEVEKECPGITARMNAFSVELQQASTAVRNNSICDNLRLGVRMEEKQVAILSACRPGGPLTGILLRDSQSQLRNSRSNMRTNSCG